jgi:AraC-like DNA-binding protein
LATSLTTVEMTLLESRVSNPASVIPTLGKIMSPIHEEKTARFALVNAGHHFLLDVLPLRHPESQNALALFIERAVACAVPTAEVDAVLLRCLIALNGHTGGRLPSLVERYMSTGREFHDCLARFSECVRQVLRYRGIGDAAVQQAIAVIESHYNDSGLTQQFVARTVGLRPAALSEAFKRQTDSTFGEYLRNIRLDHAATLLVTTAKSIKEVWSHVGYNHPSNFDHDFKRRFADAPREYRARAIRPELPERYIDLQEAVEASSGARRETVAIVDDDEGTRTTIGRYLQLKGYTVVAASSAGELLGEADRTTLRAILLDYQLPDMNGLECLRVLRRRPGRPPAIALFTADWDIYDKAAEVHALNAIIASKLCDLEEVHDLVVYLCQ